MWDLACQGVMHSCLTIYFSNLNPKFVRTVRHSLIINRLTRFISVHGHIDFPMLECWADCRNWKGAPAPSCRVRLTTRVTGSQRKFPSRLNKSHDSHPRNGETTSLFAGHLDSCKTKPPICGNIFESRSYFEIVCVGCIHHLDASIRKSLKKKPRSRLPNVLFITTPSCLWRAEQTSIQRRVGWPTLGLEGPFSLASSIARTQRPKQHRKTFQRPHATRERHHGVRSVMYFCGANRKRRKHLCWVITMQKCWILVDRLDPWNRQVVTARESWTSPLFQK